MKTTPLHLLLAAAVLLLPAFSQAQTVTSGVPGLISYQGRVLNSAGGLVGAGTPVNRTVIFRIWDHPSNTLDAHLIYSESQTVTISEGEFSVLVGQGSANTMNTFTYSESAKGPPTVSIANAFNGSTRYLGVTVAAAAAIAITDNEITPRQQIVSSAFALRSKFAETLGTNAPGASPALTVVDSGNIGVGNTDPPARLTVTAANTGTSTAQMILSDSSAPASSERLLIGVDDTGSGSGFLQATKVGTGAQNLLLNPSGGNVGIRTSSPRSILDIAPAAGSTDGIRVGKWADTASRYIGITDQAAGFTFPTTGGFSGLEFGGPSSAAEGFLAFHTHDSGASSAERMRIDKLGNVGIGTTSPTQKLDVAGSALVGTGDNSAFVVDSSGFARFGIVKKAGTDPIITAASGSHILFGQSNQSSLFTNIVSSTLTEYMRIQNGGNVGIGTTSPAQKLDVAGIVQATSFEVRAASSTPYIDFSSTAGADYHARIIWQGTGTNRLDFEAPGYMFNTGAMGIGTAPNSSRARLTVGSVGTTAGNGTPFPLGRYLDNNDVGNASGPSNETWGGGNVSIEATANIVCNGVFATSDERIKKVLGQSDAAADLKTLLGIKVTDYVFKDQIANGGQPQKKVIAQQLEKVFPQAVSQGSNTVPDIFKKAAIEADWIMLTTDLKKGDRVKLIDEKDAEAIHEVLEVKEDKFRTAFKTEAKNVFVYGREVNDFRRVDYEAISMLNVSATQQIKKEKDAEVKALKDENTELKAKLAAQDTRLATLEAQTQRLADLEAKDKAREAKLAAIEKLLLAADRAAVKPVSLKKSAGGAE